MKPETILAAVPWLLSFFLTLILALTAHAYLAERDAFVKFKTKVEQIGEQARIEKKRTEDKHRVNKEATDATYSDTIASLRADVKRLRDSNSRGSGLRAPAPGSTSPDRTCFDTAKLNAALQHLDNGILEIVERGSEATIGLDSAKSWATLNRIPVKE